MQQLMSRFRFDSSISLFILIVTSLATLLLGIWVASSVGYWKLCCFEHKCPQIELFKIGILFPEDTYLGEKLLSLRVGLFLAF